ncbi:hypothetical protein OG361_40515 [Streptomyces sp. NBC_00090]|uniref:hypothetical protein n=1 Tax=Streptomyces sp. NBC_00090 TaxID=2903619 RepID=UPI00324F1D10
MAVLLGLPTTAVAVILAVADAVPATKPVREAGVAFADTTTLGLLLIDALRNNHCEGPSDPLLERGSECRTLLSARFARAERGLDRLHRDAADLHRSNRVRTRLGNQVPEVGEGLQGDERILHRSSGQVLLQDGQQGDEGFGEGDDGVPITVRCAG